MYSNRSYFLEHNRNTIDIKSKKVNMLRHDIIVFFSDSARELASWRFIQRLSEYRSNEIRFMDFFKKKIPFLFRSYFVLLPHHLPLSSASHEVSFDRPPPAPTETFSAPFFCKFRTPSFHNFYRFKSTLGATATTADLCTVMFYLFILTLL
jgi:hypothetical protein